MTKESFMRVPRYIIVVHHVSNISGKKNNYSPISIRQFPRPKYLTTDSKNSFKLESCMNYLPTKETLMAILTPLYWSVTL